MSKVLIVVFSIAAVSYLLICVVLYFLQVRILFPGEPLPDNFKFRDFEGLAEVLIPIDEGNLSALHFKNPSPKGLLFFLHGNAGNLHSWVPDVDFYRKEAFDLFMLDYRGYGKSDGRITSQKQLIDDVYTAWEQISPEYKDANIPIMIYGRSIGSFLAADLASKVEHDALVLVSPYSSLQSLVKEKLPWLPSFILRFKLDTGALLTSGAANVALKTYLLHGSQDEIIPVEHARRLEMLVSDISLTEVLGAGHGDIHDFRLYQSTMSKIARSIHR